MITVTTTTVTTTTVSTSTVAAGPNQLSELEMANVVVIYDVNHTASFLIPLQPEWWLPIQDDPVAFDVLEAEVCLYVLTVIK